MERKDLLLRQLAVLTNAGFQAHPDDGRARTTARDAAVTWMNYRIDLGRPHADALSLCASAEGSEAACLARGHDVGATFVITLVSRPMGATVKVGGHQQGVTPCTVELKAGRHEVQLELEGSTTTRTIDVEQDQPTRWMWTRADDAWQGTL